mgnify:CR=1 FL=1
MAMTRGQLLDRCAKIIGDDSSDFRTTVAGGLDHMLFSLWDRHDWAFKHKTGTFTTVLGTESYNLSSGTPDLRSTEDLDVVYDKTNGLRLRKVDLRAVRKVYPKEDSTGKPAQYASWGAKTIFLTPNPDGAYVIKFLYLSKPTLPTADANDLETQCGLPDYVQFLFEKMVLAEAMLYSDDSRRPTILQELESILLPKAIEADMRHLESGARFKFWEEELSPTSLTYDDYLRNVYFSEN